MTLGCPFPVNAAGEALSLARVHWGNRGRFDDWDVPSLVGVRVYAAAVVWELPSRRGPPHSCFQVTWRANSGFPCYADTAAPCPVSSSPTCRALISSADTDACAGSSANRGSGGRMLPCLSLRRSSPENTTPSSLARAMLPAVCPATW